MRPIFAFIRVLFDNTDNYPVLCTKESGTRAGNVKMKSAKIMAGVFCALMAALPACELLDDDWEKHVGEEDEPAIALEEVAGLLSSVPIGPEQMGEVMDAASASAGNGYDEEYRMTDLFAAPGTGVGSEADTRAAEQYGTPLRDLLARAVRSRVATRAGDPEDAEAYLEALSSSDVQIYWPYSEGWDGETLPVITYDPGEGALENVGYALQEDGTVEEVRVDEEMAQERPVWVVNRNADSQHKTLELLRKEDPSWGQGGGDIVIRPSSTKADAGEVKTLVLRSFKARRQFDSWFAGGAEFFVRIGSVENLRATSEEEFRKYEPTVTDFMVVVRRKQLGEMLTMNTILVSEWTPQLENCAFMITEDDGGTRTTWKCSLVGKYNSKQYGFELELPLNERDDIVWRGSLTHAAIEKYSGTTASFGDVDLVLELL